MPPTIDDARVQELLAQGLSQHAIAKELHVPRTNLRRHLARLQGKPEPAHRRRVHTDVHDVHMPDQLADSLDDLTEIIAWWRERKQLTQTPPDPERQPERKTYYVEKRYIAAIERAADLERVSITEIVNRAFRHYFASTQS